MQDATIAVVQHNPAGLEVYLWPAKIEDLALPCAGGQRQLNNGIEGGVAARISGIESTLSFFIIEVANTLLGFL
ncbi:MAG: hypothetical protein HND59_12800 [Pseudomonadota bacterium]|nr:MAG: hypothetical protein HND59_12800 [Pseudomonadota bacterium]